jgi:predicted ester cyclase
MPGTQNHSLINQIFEEAFNQGNLSVIGDAITPNHLSHSTFGGSPNSPAGLKWLITMFRTAFPDLHCTVEDEISEGDKFAAHWSMRGTHKGLFMGNPPTGMPVQVQGIIFAKFEGGKIMEYWMLIDQFGMLQQLGIIPG